MCAEAIFWLRKTRHFHVLRLCLKSEVWSLSVCVCVCARDKLSDSFVGSTQNKILI